MISLEIYETLYFILMKSNGHPKIQFYTAGLHCHCTPSSDKPSTASQSNGFCLYYFKNNKSCPKRIECRYCNSHPIYTFRLKLRVAQATLRDHFKLNPSVPHSKMVRRKRKRCCGINFSRALQAIWTKCRSSGHGHSLDALYPFRRKKKTT